MSRCIGIIQARMSSTRFRGKSLTPIAGGRQLMPVSGKPLILHVLERVSAIDRLDGVVLAIPERDTDDELARVALEAGYSVMRGPEDDVLKRVRLAAELARADIVMRVTGDCPLLAPDVSSRVLDAFIRGDYGYVSNNTSESGYPDGTDTEVFLMSNLQLADVRARKAHEREHVTAWIRENVRVATITSFEKYGHLKWSVDTEEDLEHVRKIFGYLKSGEFDFKATLQADREARHDVEVQGEGGRKPKKKNRINNGKRGYSKAQS